MSGYSLYGVRLNASTVIPGVTSAEYGPNIDEIIDPASGDPYPSYSGVRSMNPEINFSTHCLAAALTVSTAFGAALTDAILGFQDFGDAAARGTSYVSVDAYKAVLIPLRLSARVNERAILEMRVIMLGDASNPPVATATTSLSLSQAITEEFTIGPWAINGTDLEVQGVDIDFGIQARPYGHSGHGWPIACQFRRIAPRIVITTEDASKLATIHPTTAPGLAVTALAGYLRKLGGTGSHPVANATAGHIKFSATQGQATVGRVGSGEDGMTTINVALTKPSGSAIWTLSTGSAIT
jgi:hypothetical protein